MAVTLAPPAAVAEGAQWRRAGSTLWHDSGTTETGVPTGATTLEFKASPDWLTPPTQALVVREGETTSTAALYSVAQTGLTWSRYLGGIGDDGANAIAIDGAGSLFITGYTQSGVWVD